MPDHLRGADYRGAAEQGFGVDYRYPHDFPGGWVDQQYLPDALLGRRFYDAAAYGRERALVDAVARPDRPRLDQDESGPPVE